MFVWALGVAVVAAFNIANRTENGAYSVLAVFGQAKETTAKAAAATLPRDLGAGLGCGVWVGGWLGWVRMGWHDWMTSVVLAVVVFLWGTAAVATFYCFCCIAKRINVRGAVLVVVVAVVVADVGGGSV